MTRGFSIFLESLETLVTAPHCWGCGILHRKNEAVVIVRVESEFPLYFHQDCFSILSDYIQSFKQVLEEDAALRYS